MIFYTDALIPTKFKGYTRGPFIFIRPECKGDKGLLEHEKVHRRQWFRTLGLHSFFYLFRGYRLLCELEAYKIQAQYYTDDRLPLFASFIAKDYNLDITQEHALELLRL